MKKRAFAVLLFALCALPRAGSCDSSAGTAAGAFLKLPSDAHRAAMGDVSAACGRGAAALFQNPAALAGNKRYAAAFSHALLTEGLAYDTLSAAVPLGRRGVVGVGAQYLRYGAIDSLDNFGNSAGSISPSDSAFTLGWGRAIDADITVGGAVKYINSKISGSAATTALDLGLLVTGDDLSFGFAAQNMGKGLKYHTESSPLPVNVKMGVYIPYKVDWEWVVDLNFPKDGAAWLGAGAEYSFDLTAKRLLFGRLGYNTAASDAGGLNGVSIGFGIQENELALDYALRTMGDLGATHHLGLSYRWGK